MAETSDGRTKVVVLGKGELAIRVSAWFAASDHHELVHVVPVVPEPAWTSSLIEWASDRGIPCVPSGRYDHLPGIRKDFAPDLAFSVFYDRIIAQWFISRCKRILNLHNGSLPNYRGVSPINWALKNCERAHGVTIHELTQEVDAGPIVSQVEYSIYPELDEVRDVYLRALAYGWTLFEQTMPVLDRITPRPQNHRAATHYRRADDALLGDRQGFTRSESRAPN